MNDLELYEESLKIAAINTYISDYFASVEATPAEIEAYIAALDLINLHGISDLAIAKTREEFMTTCEQIIQDESLSDDLKARSMLNEAMTLFGERVLPYITEYGNIALNEKPLLHKRLSIKQ